MARGHKHKVQEHTKHVSSNTETHDYLSRIAGVFLILIGAIGVIFTSPLVLAVGFLGFLGGLLFGKAWDAGFVGARIGSLGSLDLVLYGLELTNATVESEETSQKKFIPIEKPSKKIDSDDDQKPLATLMKDLHKKTKEPKPSSSTNATPVPTALSLPSEKESQISEPKQVDEEFLKQINSYIARDEAKAQLLQVPSNERNVGNQYITNLISMNTNPLSPSSGVLDRLAQMSPRDIQIFVSQLDSKGLDSLWLHFKGFEHEPSKRENNKTKLAQVLGTLSEEQIKAAFVSPNFLNILNKDAYAEAVANTLTRKQLELFASDANNQDLLNSLIKKFKPSPFLLGKIVSIMPYANETVREALMVQISHLPHKVSFKTKLAKLAQHHISINNQLFLAGFDARPQNQLQTQRTPSKWAPVQAATGPVYNTAPIKKEDITDETFEAFIQQLNSKSYIIYEQNIVDVLSHLPDYRIKMLVERASLPEFDSLLNNLWFIEAKTVNQKSFIDSRENRLRIILLNLSEPQLIQAEKQSKFWEILKNKQDGISKMAANSLTPEQFVTIIANTSLERHINFAMLISQINRDTEAEKARLQQIIEAVLPYTTPWFALELEWKISDYNQPLFDQFMAKLKMHLSESLQNPDVSQKYRYDSKLNKNAISKLVIELEQPLLEPVANLGS